MLSPRRVAVALAFVLLAGALLVCMAPAPARAVARPTAVVAVWSEDPNANLIPARDPANEPRDRLLRLLDPRRRVAAGAMSAIPSHFNRQQAPLAISQGRRPPAGA